MSRQQLRLNYPDMICEKMLCDKAKTDNNGNYKWVIRKPWASFTQDTYLALENIIVSFKAKFACYK